MKCSIRSKIVKKIIHSIALLCIAAAAGMLLLVFVYLLPTEPMAKHAQEALEYFGGLANRHYVIEGQDATILDNYTEAIMLNTACYQGDLGVWGEAAAANRYSYEGKMEVESFLSYVRGESGWGKASYARDWNGYLVTLKPLLMFFSYSEIKLINLVLQIMLTGAVTVAMARRGLSRYIEAFLLGICFLMPLVNVMSLEYSQIYYVTMGALWIFLVGYERLKKKQYFEEFYLCVGILACYVDFLTYPLVSLGFLLIIQMALEQGEGQKTIIGRFLQIIRYAIFWGIGYVGIWGAKWCIASVILRQNILGEALGMIIYRSSANDATSGALVRLSRWTVLGENVKMLLNPAFVTAALVFAAAVIVKVVRMKGEMNFARNHMIGSALLIAVFPIAWLMFKSNHSHIHAWMTYRELATVVFAFAAALVSITGKRVENQNES